MKERMFLYGNLFTITGIVAIHYQMFAAGSIFVILGMLYIWLYLQFRL